MATDTLDRIVAIMTGSTCGDACWKAAEDVCRCSCGGQNHGCERDGRTAERTATLDRTRYRLVAVGRHAELLSDAERRLRDDYPSRSSQFGYTYPWRPVDPGSPLRVKYATRAQIDRWTELSAYRGLDRSELYFAAPALLWEGI